jgi:TPP-dependent pyruvate/acetoin dehydrogenase alpha subunit
MSKDIFAKPASVLEGLSSSDLLDMYTKMLRIRYFNARQAEEAKRGNIFGYVHLYTGQESVAVGVISALEEGDKITSTHRSEGHFIAADTPLKEIMAECFGRVTGLCGGRGGPMGLSAYDAGVISSYEVVGGGISIATGVAWAFKKMDSQRVAVCFFGDGAANQGVLYESMNMAALWKIPVIYVCENNGYAVDTSIEHGFAVTDIASRTTGFGLPGVVVDGTDVLAVYAVTKEAVKRARVGEGPTFIEARALRWCGHSEADPQWYYRSREEVEASKKNCPIGRLRVLLLEHSVLSKDRDQALREQVKREVEDAAQFAHASPWPEEKDLYRHLYADDDFYTDSGGDRCVN